MNSPDCGNKHSSRVENPFDYCMLSLSRRSKNANQMIALFIKFRKRLISCSSLHMKNIRKEDLLSSMGDQLTLNALDRAFKFRGTETLQGLIHHFDQGVQYASRLCRLSERPWHPDKYVKKRKSIR